MIREPGKTIEQIEAPIAPPVDLRAQPKVLAVVRRPDGLYAISFLVGGEVPDTLKGCYTSAVRAEAAIAQHNARNI